MDHNYTISTPSIFLLPLSPDDNQKLRVLRNREDNRKWFKTSNIISEESQTAWYKNYLASSNEIMFSVHDAKTNDFLGAIGLYDINTKNKQAEIGRLLIDRQLASGRGLGTEVITAVFKIAFYQLNLSRIYAEIYADNISSIKSCEKAHFFVQDRTFDANGNPMVITEITKETFLSVCPPLQN